jgi:light-regulated signal transduction histidine kinase (bacteriophytochrome)/CheY-like chemotaxis protein
MNPTERSASAFGQVDLTNCDREPIHIPGRIQPHGALLACDADLSVIRRHSLNAAHVMGLALQDVNGCKLDELVGEDATHDLRNALLRSVDPARPGLMLGMRLPTSDKAFNVAVHQFKGNAIVEFEPAQAVVGGSPLEVARALVARLNQVTNVDDLCNRTVRYLRGALGYDRVMLYRFAHDGSGQVVSEAKSPQLETFMGRHFPASDIPRQARELYLRNTIRVIPDASGASVDIEPVLDASGNPLDLSFANLRSVSPIHCEYLRNMGVAASMSVSIIVSGKLWGLIACHHYSPRTLPMPARIAAELFGDFFSLHLQAMLRKQSLDTANHARRALDGLLRNVAHHTDLARFLRESICNFEELMPCDGIGLWMNGRWTASGSVPPDAAIPALSRFVNSVADGQVWATHSLSEGLPQASDYQAEASGVLAIPLSHTPRDYLFLFRKEVIQTINWAGNPEKDYKTGPLGDRLTPRTSFEIWKQTVERQSHPWTQADLDIAEATRTALLEVLMRHSELLSEERRKADLRQRMLNEELNHRVKNILSLIKSLVSHPVDEGRDLQDYVTSLQGRIQALSHAHDQIVRGDGGGALRDLLEAELSPYLHHGTTITLDGPQIGLDSRAFSVMALVLHELATNAAKYGALSNNSGKLNVRWHRTDEGGCEIVWRESDGPAVKPPRSQGFGSVLINRSIPYDLGGESEITFDAGGVTARFFIPGKYITHTLKSERSARKQDHQQVANDALDGLKILLVEDQLVIAMDAEMMLAGKGASAIETAASPAEALRKLSHFTPDAAVLDVNLGTETSLPVAEELARRNIPFVFATGYGDNIMVPQSFSAPTIRKPYDEAALARALNAAMQQSAK